MTRWNIISKKNPAMWRHATGIVLTLITLAGSAFGEPVRAAYPSANVQFLPAFVALEKGFYKTESLEAELISVRSAVTAVQALVGNQIHFIFSVGPQMPAIWEGTDIILLAQQVGRPTLWWLGRRSRKSPISKEKSWASPSAALPLPA